MTEATPLYQLFDGENRIYIKRDDLLPISFGGNKVRKAINFFKEIEQGKYDSIVTYGSSSSNHCRVISNLAAARNLPCYIVSPKEASNPTFNSKMMEMFNAEIIMVTVKEVHYTIETKLEELKMNGRKPYFIAGGGHGNLGTQAYVDCYQEIKEYEKENNIHFDYIFLASGTGTTQAGLICGQILNDDNREIIGISIARKNPRGRQVVLASVYEYLGVGNEEAIEQRTHFIDDYVSDGYGHVCEEINKIIKEVLTKYGIPLDSTYTGKAFFGMKKYIDLNKIKGKNILFIHTGGVPLFFDYLKGV